MSRTAKSSTKSAPRKCSKRESEKKPNAPVRSNASEVSVAAPAGGQKTERLSIIEERSTKQERVLTLLSRPEGASVAEMMQATNWQQHSVRGFLAGTVKKKLGFSLTSSKATDDVRRYHVKARRGR